MSDDPAKIAAALTKAQRRAVVQARFWQGSGAYNPPGDYVRADRRVRWALALQGVVRDYIGPVQRLTPLGLRVRTILQETHP